MRGRPIEAVEDCHWIGRQVVADVNILIARHEGGQKVGETGWIDGGLKLRTEDEVFS